jgi:predicted TIM-barrel fold metal-dependent hydrolase
MRVKDVEIAVIDADTHLVEPFDLWTSRLPNSMKDRAPEVHWDEEAHKEMWFLNGEPIFPAMMAAYSGWHEYPPSHPPTWEDADPVTYDAKARLEKMDQFGIQAQVLYPNIAMFNGARLRALDDRKFQNLLISVFNDWQIEWSGAAPKRLFPMASLPFWDLDATIDEIERTASLGFRGVVFSQNPAAFGLPSISDRHWDPVWARLQEIGIPVNFHIGSGDFSLDHVSDASSIGKQALFAAQSVSIYMANAATMVQLTMGGVCHRFPKLNFVSVESGAGYIPYVLEAADWNFLNNGVHKEHPEFDLLPSEYWRRQIYACFWFERASVVHAIQQLGPDNFLFETDFPHPTSQIPGPASHALPPNEYVAEALDSLSIEVIEKILRTNATRIYGLD